MKQLDEAETFTLSSNLPVCKLETSQFDDLLSGEMQCQFLFQNDELSFDEGDLLYILDMSNSDWWKAKCGSNTGLIPSNYGKFPCTFLSLHLRTKFVLVCFSFFFFFSVLK